MSDPAPRHRPRVGIVGIGLVGGSIGLALRNPGREVIGCDASPAAENTALARQCVDRIEPLDVVCQSDVVFIAVPPRHLLETTQSVSHKRAATTVLTDCSSVKAEITSWAAASGEPNFVPGHPMAGHEKSGCEYASAWLFRSARWILTPVKSTSKDAVRTVEALVKEMGAQPVRLKAEDHDRHVALLSHVPHVLAAALVRQADTLEHWDVGAGSWKDLTRVGGVDPKLWSQILHGNRLELSIALLALEKELAGFRAMLTEEDGAPLEQWLVAAKSAKERQTPKPAPFPRASRRRRP